ncbi:MAG: cell envelope integrity protein CreD [Pseudomonadales bacterium]
MQRTQLFRLFVIGSLIVVLAVCLTLVSGIISERRYLADSVRGEIADSTAQAQTLTAPLIVVPYRKRVHRWIFNERLNVRQQIEDEESGSLTLLPETLVITGDLDTEMRQRGIYEALLYRGAFSLQAAFTLPPDYGVDRQTGDYTFDVPELVLGLTDVRGIAGGLTLAVDGTSVAFAPGSGAGSHLLSAGVHATLAPGDTAAQRRLDVTIALTLLGTDALRITPLGSATEVALHADWPHPSFAGRFLPAQRQVDATGFNASWQTTAFATDMRAAIDSCARGECGALDDTAFGVRFVDPVNHYVKSDRALKYGLLFIVLTFAGVFLHEVLCKLTVHPIQYGLVGLAMVTFYLLLLALAEHLGFAAAYALSTLGCVGLIGFYLLTVLRSRRAALAFTGELTGLYAALYLILDSEDFALLLGSLLVFAALATLMIATRGVDWYALDRRAPATAAAPGNR